MGTSNPLTQEILKTCLKYEPDTGTFIWLKPALRSRAKPGDEAGKIDHSGYRSIKINQKDYLGHRLAWLYAHGYWPSTAIDHINGCRSDNRISNLRLATESQNQSNRRIGRNNTSGFKGVSWSKKRKAWIARITFAGIQHQIGAFRNAEEAAAAVMAARPIFHGEFACHG